MLCFLIVFFAAAPLFPLSECFRVACLFKASLPKSPEQAPPNMFPRQLCHVSVTVQLQHHNLKSAVCQNFIIQH